MLTQERLKELLHYDPDTGVFRRLCGPRKGKIAGFYHSDVKGYRKIRIGKLQFYEHRLAWFYVYGVLPHQIDHVNCNKRDNRLINLRVATPQQNSANRRCSKNNIAGTKGVNLKKTGRWYAQIMINGKNIHVGSFATQEEASRAYEKAANDAFGEFARAS